MILRSAAITGNHVTNDRVYKYRTQSADWMVQQLGLPKS